MNILICSSSFPLRTSFTLCFLPSYLSFFLTFLLPPSTSLFPSFFPPFLVSFLFYILSWILQLLVHNVFYHKPRQCTPQVALIWAIARTEGFELLGQLGLHLVYSCSLDILWMSTSESVMRTGKDNDHNAKVTRRCLNSTTRCFLKLILITF